MGDNGAGKSTLVKIIAGNFRPTNGKISIEGREVEFHRPIDARDSGIEIVYQDLALCDNLSRRGQCLPRPRAHLRHRPAADSSTIAAMNERAGRAVPRTEVGNAAARPGARRCRAASARRSPSRARGFPTPKIVLMDEPTAAISVRQVAEVLNLIRELKRQGIAVVLISHRMPDVFAVADRIVVLRRGSKVADKRDRRHLAGRDHRPDHRRDRACLNAETALRTMTARARRRHRQQTHTPLSWIFGQPAFWVFLAAVIACLALSVAHRHVRDAAEPLQRHAQLRLRRPSSRSA